MTFFVASPLLHSALNGSARIQALNRNFKWTHYRHMQHIYIAADGDLPAR
jgi:hypothetical protein